jgi:predicted porin
MKKSLLALAVLGTLTSAAYAQTSNVTIYGLVDANINRIHNSTGTKWAQDSGDWAGSRLGFKGTEDLGGGLSAIFNLENGFNVDSGTQGQGALFGRLAFVGLSSKTAGTVTLGRQKTSLYETNATLDPFGDGLAGNVSGSIATGASGKYFDELGTRFNNEVRYTSANLAGFTGKVGYIFGEQANNFSADNGYDLGLSYANGPLNLMGAYSKVKADVGSDANKKAWQVGGTYDFQVAKLALMYGQHKYGAGSYANTSAGGTVAAGGLNNRTYMLGVTVPVGAFSILASYLRTDDRNTTNLDYDRYSLGALYALSKRTTLYTSVGYEKNHGAATDTGNKFSVGIDHTF